MANGGPSRQLLASARRRWIRIATDVVKALITITWDLIQGG